VPIAPDGTAGKATVEARGYSPFDGIAFDDKANIYVSEINTQRALGIVTGRKQAGAGRQQKDGAADAPHRGGPAPHAGALSALSGCSIGSRLSNRSVYKSRNLHHKNYY
jgi:hypothetical protein